MGDITKNISQRELDCKCGDPECQVTILKHEPIISIVQECCNYFAGSLEVDRVTLRIHSGARCFLYNRSNLIGSNDNSQHPRCCAIDFSIDGVAPYSVYSYLVLRYPHRYGIGKYKTFTHIDTRPIRARWKY